LRALKFAPKLRATVRRQSDGIVRRIFVLRTNNREENRLADKLSYSINTFSDVTDISKSQIKKAIYSGDLPAVKNGVAWLILAEDARAYLRALPRPRRKKAQNQVDTCEVAA
jgi:hypothetical protein